MSLSIAHLGPIGTYAEVAALTYQNYMGNGILIPYPSISQTIKAVVEKQVNIAVVPVENSIEGGVTMTLDTLWMLDNLYIQQGLILPIQHCLLSRAKSLEEIKIIYSHPQALGQCQQWLEKFLPDVKLIPTNATTEGLKYVEEKTEIGAIASERAAEIYNLPILVSPINDHPDNATKFWVLSQENSPGGSHTSIAFSLPENVPGALVKVLQLFAENNINMSRIESRPTKRSLGEYVFFVDLEVNLRESYINSVLSDLENHTEKLKIFGSYSIISN